jgi:hypothetical protein
MAIDEKHLIDAEPAESAVARLRKTNRRIRPWESSLVNAETEPKKVCDPEDRLSSGRRTPRVTYLEGNTNSAEPKCSENPRGAPPSRQDTQRVAEPEDLVPSGSSNPRIENPEGISTPELGNPDGQTPSGEYTLRAKRPEGGLSSTPTSQRKERTAGSRLKKEYPEGKTPRGCRTDGQANKNIPGSLDNEGGFDPKPFLPQSHQALQWRERGQGEFRIPHRINEFTNRVTATRNELLVLNCLLRFSLGFHRSWCEAGYSFICAWTGISDVTNVRKSIRSLMAQGIIQKAREHDCASNAGSVYEVPVVQAYLNYLKARGGPGGGEPDPNDNFEPTPEPSPPGDLPSGSATQRAENPQSRGRETLTPGVKTPPKKENINKNSKETLSSVLPPELQNYLEKIKAPTKRESELFFLKKILEKYDVADVLISLNHVVEKGTLGAKEKCHSPMKYLSTAIEDVLAKAKPVRTVTESPAISGQLAQVPCRSEGNDKRGAETIQAFDTQASEAERAKFMAIATEENSRPSFVPPLGVIKILAAGLWVRSQRATI